MPESSSTDSSAMRSSRHLATSRARIMFEGVDQYADVVALGYSTSYGARHFYACIAWWVTTIAICFFFPRRRIVDRLGLSSVRSFAGRRTSWLSFALKHGTLNSRSQSRRRRILPIRRSDDSCSVACARPYGVGESASMMPNLGSGSGPVSRSTNPSVSPAATAAMIETAMATRRPRREGAGASSPRRMLRVCPIAT
jgi:hypothetical protein